MTNNLTYLNYNKSIRNFPTKMNLEISFIYPENY